ncbi:hypothetical protein [Streptomyces sp. NPDC007264]|uniref:hypothetical protein n=1 Tax=Streptomyces sp. NPDC007264 TaxID=3364777 RepID=UPI0036DDB524
MTRVKKYMLAASVALALTTAVPAMSYAAPTPGTSATATVKASPIRVVQPGEHVQAVPGVEMWLTGEGKHWSIAGFEQFRSVVDGNIDMSRPGVSYFGEGLEETGDNDTYLVHGIYYGTRKAARVTLTKDGTVTEAAMLELPGNPKWGAYYLTVPATGGGQQTVTVYDKAGRVLADLTVDN